MTFVKVLCVFVGLAVMGVLGLVFYGHGRDAGPLRVVLYPYIPARLEFFYEIERSFRSKFPEVKLEIVDLSQGYYEGQNGLAATKADVYEIDSVFLYDFAMGRRIQELPGDLVPAPNEFLRNAERGAQLGGKWYGVPHWVCGNFLFFKATDAALSRVRTLRDLEAAIGMARRPGRGLFIDLKGKSTLGELYLDAAFDRHTDWANVARHLTLDTFDSDVETDLIRVQSLCDSSFCRSERYHDAIGFYARQFARGRARAVVGYSEVMFYLSSEFEQSCSDVDRCLSPATVDVTELPLADRGSQPISWTCW